jgi:hypothetical protein
MDTLATLHSLLRRHRLPLHDEKATQQALADLLVQEGIAFSREHILGPRDTIDFLLEGWLGVEIKLKGQPSAIVRQCERYCAHERIQQLVLVTAKSMRLPSSLHGKPTTQIFLGQSWL